jgi:tripeptide aminopeptidase
MIDRQRLVQTFLELVRIDGISGNEAAMAQALAARLTALGIPSQQDAAGSACAGNAGNVIGRLEATAPGAPPILLSAHMDTVQPTRGIKPALRDGVIASDQTTILGADDRAGISAILEILAVLKERRLPHGPIEIVFTVAEEIGMHGAKFLKRADLQARLGFVFDSSAPPGNVVVQAPGAVAFKIFVHGKAAHAAVWPEKGVHAIQIAGRALADLKLGRVGEIGTVNVGLIQGGKAINVVPDCVELQGEVRSPDEEEINALLHDIERRFAAVAKKAGGSIAFEATRKYAGFRLTDQDQVVQVVAAAIARAGFQPKTIKYPGGSDANVFNEKGIPTVNLGLGVHGAHSFQESITVDNLAAAAKIGLEIVNTAAQLGQEP